MVCVGGGVCVGDACQIEIVLIWVIRKCFSLSKFCSRNNYHNLPLTNSTTYYGLRWFSPC